MLKAHPISKYLTNEDGTIIKNPNTGFQLTPTISPSGYLKIGNYICSGGTVHQMVYETFIGLVPKGKQINHKNGIKSDNRLENLEVVSPSENTRHAYRIGLASGKKGETNSQAKVSEKEIHTAYSMFNNGLCNECVGRELNLHPRYVSLLRSGKRWKHLDNKMFPKSNKWKCVCSSATTIETTSNGGRE